LSPVIRIIPNAVDPAIAEHYRMLRTKILQLQAERPFRSLVVTSPGPQEGKTVTVLNLGMSFAMVASLKVLVVDGDMRKGTMGRWLGVDDGQPGLSNLIDGSARLEDVVLKAEQVPMHFMVRGNTEVADLHASQLADHFQRLREQYDLVLVDTPPVNLVADVHLLAVNCDAVLLVARAFTTTRRAYEKAVEDLSPFQLIGTVLNAGTAGGRPYYYGYH
jgi:capsular exopolysaccharide synthesis family protein